MISTKGLTGARSLLRVLDGMGVTDIFASPGSEWSPVWEALAAPLGPGDSIPRYHSTRHEELALSMASGFAKATGRLPAVMIHTTVGALHASMAMRTALHEQVPMVILAGESVGFGEEDGPDPAPWWLAHLADAGGPARLVRDCAKSSVKVDSKALLPAMVQRACQLAMAAPRGPVFLSVPMEYLFETMTRDAPPAPVASPPPVVNGEGIQALADMLAGAKNPVIVTEHAGRNTACVARIVELAELLGIAVIESSGTEFMNFPRDHPLHGGFDVSPYMAETDAILLLGAVLPWHPPSKGPGSDVRIAALDEDPLRSHLPYWGIKLDLCLAGDIEESLVALIAAIRRLPAPAQRAARAATWHDRNALRKKEWGETASSLSTRQPIDTRWAVHEINAALPVNAMLVEETVSHRLAVHQYIDRLLPGSYYSGYLGGLGTGLGTALGVKVAAPDRPVVCLIGDGSFHYDPALAALGFSQEYSLPILIVLLNNFGYQSQKMGIPRHFPQGWAVKNRNFVGTSITPGPDYPMIARAYAGYGELVDDPQQMQSALARGFAALAGGNLALIEIRLQPVNPD